MNIAMERELKWIGWGLVIVMLDIRIVQFDVFPDFIGYLMIAFANRHLISLSAQFRKVKYLANGLAILTVPNINAAITDFSTIPFTTHMFAQALVLLHMVMAYWIFNGLAAAAQQESHVKLLNSILARRKEYLFFNIVILTLFPFLINLEESWTLLLFLFGFIVIINELLLIRLPFRLSRASRTKRSSE